MEHITNRTFESFTKKLEEPIWLHQYRVKSFSHFLESKMPSFKHGLNILIKPQKYDFSNLKPGTPEVEIHRMNFISPISFTEVGFPMDKESYQAFFTDTWNQDGDKLHFFHQAFFNNFEFIRIPRNSEILKPLEVHLDIKKGPFMKTYCILAEANAQARIIIHKKTSSNEENYISEDVRIIAHENSRIEFVTIQDINKTSVSIQKRKALCKKNAYVKWIDLCLGSQYTKSDIISALEEHGASTENIVLFLGSDEQRYDIYTASHHKAPETNSNIVTKGVLNQKAKALSRGLVKIYKQAFGSNGYEKQDVLLLSEKAEADAIPNLEIDNHDVKCSHGSTIGQIDAEKLFYLTSRGIDEETAKQKIVEGYFEPVLVLLQEEIRDKIKESLIKALQ